MNILYRGKLVPAKFWSLECGNVGCCSIDTETTAIVKGQTPRLILASAYNGEQVWFIRDCDIANFLRANRSNRILMANAAFDTAVCERAAKVRPLTLIDGMKIVDVLLLADLISIGCKGTPAFDSLESLCQTRLGIELPKDQNDASGDHIRTSFGKFVGRDGFVDYNAIPTQFLDYAARDAIVTFEIAQILIGEAEQICDRHLIPRKALLSHHIQLKASGALYQISTNGLYVDTHKRESSKAFLKKQEAEHLACLKSEGWEPGKGSSSKLQAKLKGFCDSGVLTLLSTPTGKLESKSESLERYMDVPFIRVFCEYKSVVALLRFLEGSEQSLHPHFRTIVSTGRTSSSSPNVQNFPRDSLVRSIFVASPGHALLKFDYSQIELRVLAQILLDRFRSSEMAELLNEGKDIHRYVASAITGKSESEITDDERRKAKACNFGWPGGLGINVFRNHAKNEYDIDLTEDQAKELKRKWLEVFPGVEQYLDTDDKLLICSSGVLSVVPPDFRYKDDQDLFWIFWKVINGKQVLDVGKVDWAFATLKHIKLPTPKKFACQIANRIGSRELWQNLVRSLTFVIHHTGRVRANATYTQSKNNLFQGIAADGAKLALYALVKYGYRVVNFIHDEFVIEVPFEKVSVETFCEIQSLIEKEMQKVCPDVRIVAEGSWMRNWAEKISFEDLQNIIATKHAC